MNSNQRSQGNNQSSNGGNEKAQSSSRGDFVEDTPLRQDQQSQQSGNQGGSRQGGQDSTERTGSQTGSQQQGMPGQHQSNDVAGGLPKSPGGKKLSADQDMDDDTGLSNRGNRQSAEEIDDGTRQEQQSNVGRRSDMTPD